MATSALYRTLSQAGMVWLGAGGGFYTIGAVCWANRPPRFWPGRFGSHDVWHTNVLSGSACHFVMMFCFVAPTP